jgi:hypothetical protein
VHAISDEAELPLCLTATRAAGLRRSERARAFEIASAHAFVHALDCNAGRRAVA